MTDVFTLRSSALPGSARLRSFRGTEALCRPYEYELFFTVPEGDEVDLSDAVGGNISLIGDRADGRAPLLVHGIFASLRLLRHASGGCLYRGVLVPNLWLLSQTVKSRLFTDMSLPDILSDVLQDGGLTSDDFALRLESKYEPEEHVCQYHESDLDFLHRWMEREGLYYFFEQRDDRELLVITDHKSFHDDVEGPPVTYRPTAGHDFSAGEAFDVFTCERVALPARVRVRDYDYAKPTLDVSGDAAVSKTGFGEVTVHGARSFTPDQTKRQARLRSEELLARETTFRAQGTPLRVRAGFRFAVSDHPRSEYDTSYLAVEVRRWGNQVPTSAADHRSLVDVPYEDVHRVEVTALAASVQFRPPRSTPWPRVYGFESATVDGEEDTDYAQIDDLGRYRLRFHFDESDLGDGKASTWVRMMQPHGGAVEGWHFPLRKGTEVVCSFLGGDPDRPVISGVVPTLHRPSPVTKTNHTTNVIQTGGKNRIEMEDLEGHQRFTVSCPTKNTFIRMGAPNDDKNLIISSDGVGRIFIGDALEHIVEGPVIDARMSTVREEYMGPLTVDVTKDVDETYNADHKTYVAGHRRCLIDAGEVRSVKGWYNLETHNTKHETGAFHQFAKGGVIQQYDGKVLQNFAGPVMQNYGDVTATYKSLNWTIPGGATVMAPTFNILAPKDHWQVADIEILATKKSEVNGVTFAANGLAVVLTAVLVDHVGLKFESASLQKEDAPLMFGNKGTEINVGGLCTLAKALVNIM
jgi:type VI secretion system secreted protein VgrG